MDFSCLLRYIWWHIWTMYLYIISVAKAQFYLITLRHYYYYHLIFIVEILIYPYSVMKSMMNSFHFRHCLCVTQIEIQKHTNRSLALRISVRSGTEFMHYINTMYFARLQRNTFWSKCSFDISRSSYCWWLLSDWCLDAAAYWDYRWEAALYVYSILPLVKNTDSLQF